jgi:hypothetical protein
MFVCLIEIKCGCKFIAGVFQFYSKIANCGDDSPADASVHYAINLPYLEQLFNTSELLRESNELLDFLPDILLPNISFQQHSTDKSAGLLQESLFNMQELAKSAINDSQIFLTIGDQIADQLAQNQLDLGHDTFSVQTLETILIFLNPILVIALVIGFARIYWQFRTITAALLLIRPRGANAATISRKVFMPNKWRTPSPVVGQRTHLYAAKLKTDRISERRDLARNYSSPSSRNFIAAIASLYWSYLLGLLSQIEESSQNGNPKR